MMHARRLAEEGWAERHRRTLRDAPSTLTKPCGEDPAFTVGRVRWASCLGWTHARGRPCHGWSLACDHGRHTRGLELPADGPP